MFIELKEKATRNEAGAVARKHLVNLDNVTFFREGQGGVTVVFGNQTPGFALQESWEELGRILERHTGQKVA